MNPASMNLKGLFRVHPDHQLALRETLRIVALLLVGVVVAVALPPLPTWSQGIAGYEPLHSLLETVAIVIAMLVFALGWNAHRRGQQNPVLLIACVFLAVGILDFSHILSFPGMPDFVTPNSVAKTINFWFAARTLAAVALFAVAVLPWRSPAYGVSRYALLGASLLLLGVLHWIFLLHEGLIPATFIPGQGLTPFKIYYEYALIVLNLLTAVLLWWRMREALPFNAAGLFGAVCVMALSELFFTLYADVTDLYNLLGHIYKAISYFYIYRAIVVSTIEEPYRQLQISQQVLQATIDAMPDLMFEVGLDGRFYNYHAPRSDLLAVPASKFIGKTIAEVMPPEVARIGMAAIAEAQLRGYASDEYELEFRKQKRQFELFVSGKPVAAAEEPRFIMLSRDITERRQGEEQLRRSEAVLRESQLIAGLGSYVLDLQTGIWESSDVLDQVFGIDAAYARTIDGWVALIHPDDREMMNRYFYQEVMARHQRFDREYRIVRHRDQVVRWVHGIGKLEFDGRGEVARMVGTVQDVTTRKLAEHSLLQLSLAVEQSPSSIVITDLDGNIEYVNTRFTEVTGYSLAEVIGKNPRILQSGKTDIATYKEMWAALTRGEIWRGELLNCRKDGTEYIESAVLTPVRQANGEVTNYLAIKEDITERKLADERIETLAHFDQLTGLPNRVLLNDRFEYVLSLARRKMSSFAVMFLDLDHFKQINDTLGHTIGDKLLIVMAQRIKGLLREEDVVSRLGGDEFILLFPATDAKGAAHVAGKLMEAVSTPCLIDRYELITSASIGIAIYPHDGGDSETLMKNADTAMYRVKRDGRNAYGFFTPQMQEQSERALLLNNALRYALRNNELFLHYQPQLSLQDESVVGVEALLRWHHPELGMISPAEFIPIAEDSGQIIPIGEWVLRTAVRQMKAWMDEGVSPVVMAVNLSSIQFRQAGLVEQVTGILDEEALPHHYLELELTEAVAMDNPEAAIAVMNKLNHHGIRMSIDDFGTGYSSLGYLKKFKVYKLKIDQSFVRDITTDPEDRAIVSAIINMASSLGICTIAEGVEGVGQLDFLRLQGCDEVQGYHFSRPLPAAECEAYLRAKQQQP
jgi:diguanylate cyclase (GGDEF)-like protein/PAS domain S-box-containing protein